MKNYWTRYNLLKILYRANTHAQKTIDRTVVKVLLHQPGGERGGSVVECRTPEREVRGSRPTAAVLCP